jgi:hypothetical protein
LSLSEKVFAVNDDVCECDEDDACDDVCFTHVLFFAANVRGEAGVILEFFLVFRVLWGLFGIFGSIVRLSLHKLIEKESYLTYSLSFRDLEMILNS